MDALPCLAFAAVRVAITPIFASATAAFTNEEPDVSKSDDLDQLFADFMQIQQELEQTAQEATDSMRDLAAVRRFGGTAQAADPEQIVLVTVDELGAPERAEVSADWRDFYSAAELADTIAGCARAVEHVRSEQAREYLAEHPEAIDEITQDEVNAVFGAADETTGESAAGQTVDPEASLLGISERLPDLTEEALDRFNEQIDNLDADDQPVRIFSMGNMLATIRVSPAFIERATSVQLNAALAQAILEHNSGEGDESQPAGLDAQLQSDAAEAAAAAQMLMSMFQSSQK